MIFSSALLLLAAAASCSVFCVELTQPPSLVVKPQESFSISCRISESSYCIHWIRQPSGKALEWLGYLCSGGGTNIKDSVKNKISFTQDTSKNTVFLQGNHFQTEDTAVYYCARQYTGAGAHFDYWGKGTKVTVSSAQPSAPKSIFPMSQCTSDSDGFLTIGCMTRGFSPADSLTFKWKDPADKELSDFVQYPAFGRDGDYTAISHMRVRKSDWDPKKTYKCEASNPKGKIESHLLPRSPTPELRATVYLTVPTKTELDNGTATFMCLAQRFSPKAYAFKWFQDGKEVTDAKDCDKSEMNGSVTVYSATSILQTTAEQWKPNGKVKCEFVHKAGNEEIEAEYTGPIQDCSDIAVDIVPPSLEDMLKKRVGVLKCKASADNSGFTKIAIKANEKVIAEASVDGNRFNVELDTPIGYEEWSNGTEFTCTVEHNELAMPKSTKFVRENACILWIEHPLYEAIDTDDSGIANTAVTFVFLFLITLFYSIGATFVKVK